MSILPQQWRGVSIGISCHLKRLALDGGAQLAGQVKHALQLVQQDADRIELLNLPLPALQLTID